MLNLKVKRGQPGIEPGTLAPKVRIIPLDHNPADNEYQLCSNGVYVRSVVR